MSRTPLHQAIVGATVGDAITDHALLIRRWLREMGYDSHIYAEHIHPALVKDIRPAISYQPGRNEKHLLLHHSIGSSMVDRLLELPIEFLMVYHNITPPEFFADVNPALAQELEKGRQQLLTLRDRTPLALAVSAYNEEELLAAGYEQTAVFPLALDEEQYSFPSNPALVEKFQSSGPRLLFVGRLVPNKKPEDLLKLLYYYRRIEPDACLMLVGSPWLPNYERWLHDLVSDLGLAGSVFFLGHVSQQDMVTYYRLADLYVSMSEHEGFGKPLVESMYMDLPVLAYSATGVPYTLGDAGVLFNHKAYEALAELVDLLVTEKGLRTRILEGQRRRVQSFLPEQVRQRLHECVAQLSTSLKI
jgi:L-malate glycosyltransferase